MKHQWRVRRQTTPYADGQRRWDRAYQLLLQWATTSTGLAPADARATGDQEVRDACGRVCPGLDHDPSPSTDH
jgi:hypothetical protein